MNAALVSGDKEPFTNDVTFIAKNKLPHTFVTNTHTTFKNVTLLRSFQGSTSSFL